MHLSSLRLPVFRRIFRLSLLLPMLAGAGLLAIHLRVSTPTHASGHAPPYLIQVVTSTNSANGASWTKIDNATWANGHPNAILEVTPNWSPNGVYDNHPIGVYYYAPYWYIFNEDNAPMPGGAAFNVDMAADNGFVQTATSANLRSGSTIIDQPGLNGQSGAQLMITSNWNAGGIGEVYDPHPIGVSYNSFTGHWSIFNEDGAPIPNGAAFNVSWYPNSYPGIGVQWATNTNSRGDFTEIDDLTSGTTNPYGLVWVTAELMPNKNTGFRGVYEPHNLGVFYNGSHWCIFNQDGTPIPVGAVFFYRIGFF